MEATVAESWEIPEAKHASWFVHLLPSLTDFAFLLPAFILFCLSQGTRVLFSDGDTGWQIRTGDWILQHGAVPRTDIFSFSKPHEAWFAWEWGTDIGLALLHRAAGLSGVAFATVLLLGLISALLFRLIRKTSGNDFLAFGFTLLAMCGSIIHWLARPHLFTWLFALIFAHAMLAAEGGNRKPLFWLPLAMLVWTNLHGGFFIGFALLFASAAGAAVQVLTQQALQQNGNIAREAWRVARPYVWCALACSAATFVNPYGWHLHQHVLTYLLDARLLDSIQEYQSPNFRQPGAIFFECMLLLGVASVFWCVRNGKYAAAMTVLLWAHLALVSVRNVPLFLLLAAPWIASMSESALEGARSLPWLRGRRSGVLGEIAREFKPIERIERWHVVSAVALALLAGAFASGRPGFEGQFNPKNFPVAALPALRATHAERLFTTDQWADYLLYRFSPSKRVFMDGRSDFYGYDFVTEYTHILNAQYGWEANLQDFSIDAVLVDPHAALASVLKESANWKIVADGGSFILFEQRRSQQERTRTEQAVTDATDGRSAAGRNAIAGSIFGIPQQRIVVRLPKLNERRSL